MADKIRWEIPVFSFDEGKRRHRKIRELMELRGIDCLIIAGHLGNYKSSAADVRYVSNYCMWFEDEYVVFPQEEEPTLFTWNRGHSVWAEKVSWIPVTVSTRTKEGRDYAGDIFRRIKELGLEKATLGIVNMKNMPAYVYAELKERLPHANFVSAGNILRDCRLVKSPEELEFVRRSGECADKGFQAMSEAAQPGVKEAELVAECEGAMVKAGAELGSFILLLSGSWLEMGNGGIPFGGSERRLRKGDIVLNEITPSYGGCYTQLCRPISIGNPPDNFMEIFQIHRDMYELARKELRPGITAEAIEANIAELASRKGDFSWAWTLQSAELGDTTVPFRSELKTGMVFVNHPFTELRSKSGYAGHIIGDTFIIKENEPECLSKLPFELKVV